MLHPKKATELPSNSSTAATRLLHQLRKSSQPIVVSINGQAELRVEDQESYEQLLLLVDRLETIEAVRESLEDMKQGKGRPAGEVFDELRRKYELPN